MRITTFAWYLKKRLIKSTRSGTLDLLVLGKLAERDHALRPLLTLYATAHLNRQQAEKRLESEILQDYGKYYEPSGYPAPSALAVMPPEYRELYDSYHAFMSLKTTRYRVKIRCREQLANLMRQRGLTLRDIAGVAGLNIGCISRFLNGTEYAISESKLRSIITVLGGVNAMNDIQVKDYSERKLEGNIIEITFTLVMPDEVAAVLDGLCEEHHITLAWLFERFLHWMAENQDEAKAWLVKEIEAHGLPSSTES